jgi:hypothetical protein
MAQKDRRKGPLVCIPQVQGWRVDVVAAGAKLNVRAFVNQDVNLGIMRHQVHCHAHRPVKGHRIVPEQPAGSGSGKVPGLMVIKDNR